MYIYLLNNSVLSSALKISTLLAFRKESGSLFHNDGAMMLKDLAAKVILFTLGTTSCLYLLLDLSILLDSGKTDNRLYR